MPSIDRFSASFHGPIRSRPTRTLAIPGLGFWLWAGACTISVAEEPPRTSEGLVEVIGITTPNQEAVLAAIGPGRITSMVIPEGGLVGKGELVFVQDEAVQRLRTEIAKAAAESTLDIELARARWERARRDLDRLSGLYGNDSASSKELSDARADADIARLEYELARFTQKQAEKAFRREAQRLQDFHATAPFAGYVTEHLRHVGETVDESDGVVRLVQLDPLKVSLDCPLTLARTVKEGDRLMVRPLDPRWAPRRATVVMVGRVINAASQTFKVKLQVDNPDAGWMAGLKAAVAFPTTKVSGGSAAQTKSSTSPRTQRSVAGQGGGLPVL